MFVYIYIYIYAQPPQQQQTQKENTTFSVFTPFQNPAQQFIRRCTLSFCRRECGDVVGGLEVSTLRCDEQGGGITLHCDVRVGPCIREPTDHLLEPLLRCDEPGCATILHCDVLVGLCIREQRQDHLQVSTLRCDEQGGGATLLCHVPVGPCIREQTDHL